MPCVSSHQTTKASPMQAVPSRNDSQSGPGLRSVSQSRSHWPKNPGRDAAPTGSGVFGGEGSAIVEKSPSAKDSRPLSVWLRLTRLGREDLHLDAAIERLIFG